MLLRVKRGKRAPRQFLFQIVCLTTYSLSSTIIYPALYFQQVRIALGQINPIIGDYSHNISIINTCIQQAYQKKADIIVFPEMALCGYPAMDLWQEQNFVEQSHRALHAVATSAPHDLYVVIGHVAAGKRKVRNMVSVLYDGRVIFYQAKSYLPTYDIFDEERYFEPAQEWGCFQAQDKRVAIAICEDIWGEHYRHISVSDPLAQLMGYNPHILLIPSASPYYYDNMQERFSIVRQIAQRHRLFVVYVNCAGANDSIIFDGHSMAIDQQGAIVTLCAGFAPDCAVVHTEQPPPPTALHAPSKVVANHHALQLGIRDYLNKSNYQQIHLGLSGGIDSAIVLVLAVQSLGSKSVQAFLMPSKFSSPTSLHDAQALATNLGVSHDILSIEEIKACIVDTISPLFGGLKQVTDENLQARIRGVLLMAYANNCGSLTLVTGNKSELATGYCTLYGDTAGALAPIGDLYKSEVYQLALYINQQEQLIPEAILTKAPSAELRPNQRDQDSLPAYEVLDGILRLYIDDLCSIDEIVAQGYPRHTAEEVQHLVMSAEHKRYQYPPVLKLSARTFGIGRRIPIVKRFTSP